MLIRRCSASISPYFWLLRLNGYNSFVHKFKRAESSIGYKTVSLEQPAKSRLLFVSFALSALILVISTGLLIFAWKAGHNSTALVEWRTAGEMNTTGYNLYRRESSSGREVRVNPDLIPAAGDVISGGNYSILDTGLQSGRIYSYVLEEVDSDGSTSRSSVIQVRAGMTGMLELGIGTLLAAVALAAFLNSLRKLFSYGSRPKPAGR